MSLSDTAVRTAKPREKSYKLYDQKGLYLQVNPNGSKLWRFRYKFGAKESRVAFGAYPEITLAGARERQAEARKVLKDRGVDPGEHKKQVKRAAGIAAANTFEVVAREWIAKHSPNWAETHTSKVVLRLENDIFPWLGSRPVSEIEPPELLDAIRRVEARGALDSAHRCLGCCSQILRYAIATARAARNPAADLRGALPPAKGGHFASITTPECVGELLRAIDGYQGNLRTRCALRLAPLTFVRPNELRKAQWTHFNLDASEWRIPGAEMKMDEDHIVPLSRQAVEIVRELEPLTGKGPYLFHCDRSARRPMSANTVNAALRRLGYSGDEMVGHGFRAMARTILDEVLEYRVDWIEHQLAHRVKDPNGRAYNRTAYLLDRRQMMQGWADYLDRLRASEPGKNVVSIVQRAA